MISEHRTGGSVKTNKSLTAVDRIAPGISIRTVKTQAKIMGDAKRRKEILGEKYGQEPSILRGVPVTKGQAEKFVKWTTQGAWIGIALLVVYWVTVRFIGPAVGWWQIN